MRASMIAISQLKPVSPCVMLLQGMTTMPLIMFDFSTPYLQLRQHSLLSRWWMGEWSLWLDLAAQGFLLSPLSTADVAIQNIGGCRANIEEVGNVWYTRAWCCLGLVFSSSQLVRSIYRYNMILAARPLHIRFSKQPQMLNWSRRLSSTSFQ